MEALRSAAGYEVPVYQAAPSTAWYHFLHGNVPGHQIDFMYRPEVPQGLLTRQHFSHLARLVKYIEPRAHSAYAFAIGNLSRDDTQYEPGRGGVAFIFGLRIRGATDHAGRRDPPFCHAIATIDRHLDESTIYQTAVAFYRKLLPDEESQAQGSGWYHTYVRHAQNPDALLPLLKAYAADFDDLPAPLPSGLGCHWAMPEGVEPPRRVVVVYADKAPFEAIAACAARIAGVLVESDIRWTAISNGREADVAGGVTVRFVPEREVEPEPRDVVMLRMDDVPLEPQAIAAQLFGAEAVTSSQIPTRREGWRHLYAAGQAPGAAAPRERVSPLSGRVASHFADPNAPGAQPAWGQRGGEEAIPVEIDDGAEKPQVIPERSVLEPAKGEVKKSPSQIVILAGIGVAIVVGGVIAAMVVGASGAPEGEPQPSSNAVPVAAETASAGPGSEEKEAPPVREEPAPMRTGASSAATAATSAPAAPGSSARRDESTRRAPSTRAVDGGAKSRKEPLIKF